MPRYEGGAAREMPTPERKKRPSLRVIEGGKRERARTLRKTEEVESKSHLEKIRSAGGFEEKVKTIRTLHAEYRARQDELLEKEQEIRGELEDILGPLEGNTPEEIRAHHLSGINKVKDWLTSITGRKSAKELAAPLLKKLQAVQNERVALHEKQVDISISSLRIPTEEETAKSVRQQAAEAWTAPKTEEEPYAEVSEAEFLTPEQAKMEKSKEEAVTLARETFPKEEETAEFKDKQELEQRTGMCVDLFGGIKEGMSDEEIAERRTRGRAEGARLWDEVNRMIQIMHISDTDFTAMDYVELAAKMQMAETDNRPATAKNIKTLLTKMNQKLGYAPGQDPLAEGGKPEIASTQPMSLEWAKNLLTPDTARQAWDNVRGRMIFNMDLAKTLIRKSIGTLVDEVKSIKGLESEGYQQIDAIKNINQGDPAEATMYVMLKALAEGNISLSEGDKKAAVLVKRALADINRKLLAEELVSAVKPEKAKKKERTNDELADELDKLGADPFFQSVEAEAAAKKKPEFRTNDELADELDKLGADPFFQSVEEAAAQDNAILQEQGPLERSTPDQLIETLVYGLPKKAAEDYTLALRKFYGTNDMDKQFAILRVLRKLDTKYKLEGSKTAERIRKTLMEKMDLIKKEKEERAKPKTKKKTPSLRKAA